MKKILALLLSLTMVFGSAIPAFAADAEPAVKSGLSYLAIGDSFAAGCKNAFVESDKTDNYQLLYESFIGVSEASGNAGAKSIDEPNSKFEKYTCYADGKQHTRWYINAVPYSNVSLFANAISADATKSWNGTFRAVRAKDICYTLGLVGDSAYKEDGWMKPSSVSGDALYLLDQVKNSAKGYKYAIRHADVITVQLGQNEFSGWLFTYGIDIVGKITQLITTAKTNTEVKQLELAKEGLEEALAATTEEEKNSGIAKFIAALSTLKETSKSAISLLNYINKSVIKAAVEQRVYWNKLMRYINRHKKRGAVVIATSVVNPFRGIEHIFDTETPTEAPNDSMSSTLLAILSSGVDINKVGKIAAMIFDPFVLDVNNHINKVAKKYNYTVAKIKLEDMEMTGFRTEQPDKTIISAEPVAKEFFTDEADNQSVKYICHPSKKQQEEIAGIILDAYEKATGKKSGK